MNAVNIYLIVVAVINFILAFIIYFKSPNRRINVFFSLGVLSVTFWTVCMIILRTVGQTNIDSLYFWSILLWVATVPIVFFYLYFCIEFPEGIASKRKRWLTRLMLLIPAVFVLVVNILYFGAFENAFIIDGGVGYTLNSTHFCIWALYIIGYFTASFITLFRKRKNAKGITRVQLTYMIYGVLPAALFGVIFGIVVPLFDSYKYFWLSEGTSVIMSVLIAYAIFKHHLFNLKVIVTELFTALLFIILFIRFVLSESTQQFLANGFIVVGFAIFGILLIRSVWKEVKTRERMEELAKELEKANVRLKELDQAKSEFVTIASHQLRSPVTAIKGYSSMLKEGSFGEVPEKAKQVVERILQSSDYLVRLIGDFLNLSRIERGKMEYDFKKFDLKDLVKSVYEEFIQINKNREAPLDFELELNENEQYSVTIDQEKIRQAISNLIDNAFKYTKKGFVKVSLYKDTLKERIILKIQDSGMGLSRDALAKIFQKFTQAQEKLSSHVEGTGLGLYVAKEIMKAHDGDIRAESRGAGKGSAFYIEFPMDFIIPEERKRLEEERKKRMGNIEEFVQKI